MKKYILSLFLVGFLLAPAFSFAQVEDVDPNPAGDCVSLQNNLRYRDRDVNKNGEVSTLQDFLQSKEYLNSEPTGYFGLATQKAVKSFQKDNNLSPTGYVGPITRAKINNLTNCEDVTLPIPSDDKKVSCKLSSNFSIGLKNDSVYLLQEALFNAGYYPEGLMTGYYGKLTNKAVDKFKSENENDDLNSLVKKLYPKECDDNVSDNTLTISGISGPQTLNVGQEGKWEVKASDSSGGNLSYSVVWGDEAPTPSGTTTSILTQQTATFTHSYANTGIYNPTFTVTNTSGGSAKTSLSVNVGTVIATNTKLQIMLNSIPDHAQDFNILVKGISSEPGVLNYTQSFNLDDDYDSTLPAVKILSLIPGTYTISQSLVNSWYTSIKCVDYNSGDIISEGSFNTYSVDIGANKTVSCVHINQLNTVPTPSITVLSPNGGENYVLGQTINIKWSSKGIGSNEKISVSIYKKGAQISQEGSPYGYITTNAGFYNWTIPKDINPNQYEVNVGYILTNGNAVSDNSDALFTINSLTNLSSNALSAWNSVTLKPGCTVGANYSTTTGLPCK